MKSMKQKAVAVALTATMMATVAAPVFAETTVESVEATKLEPAVKTTTLCVPQDKNNLHGYVNKAGKACNGVIKEKKVAKKAEIAAKKEAKQAVKEAKANNGKGQAKKAAKAVETEE